MSMLCRRLPDYPTIDLSRLTPEQADAVMEAMREDGAGYREVIHREAIHPDVETFTYYDPAWR